MRRKDPLSIANLASEKNPFIEADVIDIRTETRTATVRLRNTSQEVVVNLGIIDPTSIHENRSRLLVYCNPFGGKIVPIAVIPTRFGVTAQPTVTLGDHRGSTAWSVANNFGDIVFQVDSMGNVTMGTYNTYSVPINASFVTLASTYNLTNERVLSDGIGTYVTYELPGGNVYVNLLWGTPTISTIEPDDTQDPGTSNNPARSDHKHEIVADAPSTNLSVSSTNAEGTGTSFTRDDHAHGIDTSSNPGAAASILASDASGYLQLTGLGITAAPASNDLHIGTGQGITHADGVTAGMILRANGTRYIPDTLDISDITDLAYATPNLTLSTSNAAGSADSVIRSDATIAVFDATVPTSLAPDDSAAAGSASVAARRDHAHGIPTAAPTTNLTVSTTNAEGSGSNFVRDSHTHAITTSNNPGAAASILASSSAGKLTLVDLALTSLTASTVIYSNASKEITSLANSGGYLYNDGAGALSWATGVTPSPHDILSASHSDTSAASVVRGDIMTGQGASPTWSRLAISVPASTYRNYIGTANGDTEPSYKALFDGTAPTALAPDDSAATGSAEVAARRDHEHGIPTAAPTTNLSVSTTNAEGSGSNFVRDSHTHAITTSDSPGAAASILASSAAGKLTLVDLALTSLTASTVVYADGSKDITSLANSTGYLYNNGAGSLSWASGATPVAHNLLSTSHGDTATHSVAEGDLAIGNATPAWDGLAISVPAAGTLNYLGVNNGETQPSWKSGSSNPGAAAAILASDTSGYLTLVRLNTDTIADKSGGDLTISPTGDIVLNPTGNDVLPTTNYDISIGSASKKFLDVHAAEITAGHIVASDTASGIRGRAIIAPTCLFAVDLSSATTNGLEKVLNTGFESAGGGGSDVFASWTESAGDGTITQDSTNEHGGSYCCKLTSGASSNTYVYQNLNATAGTQIAFGFWTAGDGTYAGRYRVYDVTHTADIVSTTSTSITGETWQKVWVDFEVPSGCTSVRIYFYCPSTSAGIAYFDDVTARTAIQITVTDNNMSDSDIAYTEASGNVEWFEICSAAGGAGPYTYWVIRDLDAGGENNWYAGDGLHNTGGQAAYGEGYIDIYAGGNTSVIGTDYGSAGSGAYIVGANRNSPTYNDVDEIWSLTPRGLQFVSNETAATLWWRNGSLTGSVLGYIWNQWAGGASDNIIQQMQATVPSGLSAGDAAIYLTAQDVDAGTFNYMWLDSSGVLEIKTGDDSFLNLGSGGQLSLGVDTGAISTSYTTVGLVINQDTNDDLIISCKSADVSHSGYGSDSDTFFGVQKAVAASGGALLRGWGIDSSGGGAAQIAGYLDYYNANTTKSTSGRAVVEVFGLQTSSGAIANIVADGNVFSIRTRRGGSYVTVAIVDEDGDLHLDAGGGTGGTVSAFAFDDYDDLALLTGLRASIAPDGHEMKRRFGDFAAYARPILEGAGVVHYNDGPGEDGRAFVSQRGLQYLTIDALRQFWTSTTNELADLRAKCDRYEQALIELGINP